MLAAVVSKSIESPQISSERRLLKPGIKGSDRLSTPRYLIRSHPFYMDGPVTAFPDDSPYCRRVLLRTLAARLAQNQLCRSICARGFPCGENRFACVPQPVSDDAICTGDWLVFFESSNGFGLTSMA